MILKDDRTPEQRATHTVIVAGTDSFMSGWGHARNGLSYAGWACKPEHAQNVLRWVESRSDMKRVRIVGNNWRPSGSCKHCHVYVVDDKHPALSPR